MSEPAFTPGPWEAVPRTSSSKVWLVEGPASDWNFTDPGDITPVGFREADARLLAAAPELYEALGAMVKLFPNIDMGRTLKEKFGLDTRQNDIVDAARTALSKACGETA